MTEQAAVEAFLSQRRLAVVGVSRSGKKFGNLVYRALKERGFEVVAVHPQAEVLEGDRCVPSVAALPHRVDGVVLVVPPAESLRVVGEAAAAGIRRVWLQPGSFSPEVLRLAQAQGMSVVAGECIMMHARPVRSIHWVHRLVRKLLGKLPSSRQP